MFGANSVNGVAMAKKKTIFGFLVSLEAKYLCDLKLIIQSWTFPKKRTPIL